MKKTNTKFFIFISSIILLILPYLFLGNDFFTYFFNQLIWFVLAIFSLKYIKKSNGKFNYKKRDMNEIAFIASISLIIIYFTSGLLIGYSNSPLDRSAIGIARNLWTIVTIKILMEIVRYKFMRSNGTMFNWIWVTTFFALLTIKINPSNLEDFNSFFNFFATSFTPAIIQSAFLSYLVYRDDYKAALIYKIPFAIVVILTPIFPKNIILVETIIKTLIPLMVFLKFERFDEKKAFNYGTNESSQKMNIVINISYIITLIILTLFATGYYRYKPVVILSNSMYPEIKRGDIVIFDKNDRENIETESIIVYNLGSIQIIHRVIHIENSPEEVRYTTKGDNNSGPDAKFVTEEQIQGTLIFSIPKLGYPTIFFKELFDK